MRSQISTLKISETDYYCHVTLRGDFSVDKVPVIFWSEVKKFCDDRDIGAILIDEKLDQRAGVASLYDYIHQVSHYLRGYKIAYLDREQDHLEINKFGEDVAYNTGLMLKTFIKMENAVEFLEDRNLTTSGFHFAS